MLSSRKLLVFCVKPCTLRPLPAAAPRFARLPNPPNGPSASHSKYIDALESETVIRVTLLRYTFKSNEVNRFIRQNPAPATI